MTGLCTPFTNILQREVEAQQADLEQLALEVLRQKRRLESALSAVTLAREEAERASRQKSDFLSLVSHELRTPLASIHLQIERLTRGLSGALGAKQSEVVTRIARAAGRLSDMVESLLQFSRLESGRVTPRRTQVDLAAIAQEILEDLRARAEAKSLGLRLELTGERALVTSDAELVRLILMNLCDNAIKYTDEGEVVVAIEADAQGGARVSVSDTGPGIAPEAQQRVFLPFEQLENVRHKQRSGFGLGLSLAKRVADSLKAEVRLHSVDGEGSTFSLVFPGVLAVQAS